MKEIKDQIMQMIGNIRKMTPERQKQMAARKADDTASRLIRAGYPDRHVSHISRMFGPGLDAATALYDQTLSTEGAILVVIGNRGPGKTQMAAWWASQRIKDGKAPGRYRKCIDVFREIKGTWNKASQNAGESESRLLEGYRNTSFLVIDEIQEIILDHSDWRNQELVNLIDHRYDLRLTTVLIGNLSFEQANREISPSILSRANECGGLKECDWPSYRDF